jgi:hypothetical protein
MNFAKENVRLYVQYTPSALSSESVVVYRIFLVPFPSTNILDSVVARFHRIPPASRHTLEVQFDLQSGIYHAD